MCSASLDLGPPAEGSMQPPCEQLVQGLSEGAELWQRRQEGVWPRAWVGGGWEPQGGPLEQSVA